MEFYRNKPSSRPFAVALIADIHGNLAALHAVLADLTQQQYDALIIAGDLISNGPQPLETLALIRELHVPAIYGNGERAIVEARPKNLLACWTRQQIGDEGAAYLAGLPFSYRIAAPQSSSPETDLLIVHATPTSVTDILILEPHPSVPSYPTPTPEHEAKRMLGDARANLIIYGHIHYASAGTIGAQRLASIGAVGFPFDGNQQAAYALVTWHDEGQWLVTHHRVTYDYERTLEAIYRSGQPSADMYARRLRSASWCR
ncbi:MAG TPA: metallophosphoesterase family protein [Ktedonobacteraceae bacterium]|jgi:predicted phosphodiesterase|nr:metallophosphoesterase family protein [Ktedonobacteraceae bacterium]